MRRALAVVLLTCVLGIITWVYTPAALALTQIKLSDLAYQDCPQELEKNPAFEKRASPWL